MGVMKARAAPLGNPPRQEAQAAATRRPASALIAAGREGRIQNPVDIAGKQAAVGSDLTVRSERLLRARRGGAWYGAARRGAAGQFWLGKARHG